MALKQVGFLVSLIVHTIVTSVKLGKKVIERFSMERDHLLVAVSKGYSLPPSLLLSFIRKLGTTLLLEGAEVTEQAVGSLQLAEKLLYV